MFTESEKGRRLANGGPSKNIEIQHPANIIELQAKSSSMKPECENKTPSDMRALAVSHAKAGLHVFRLEVGSKKPPCGSRSHLDATSDPEAVYKLWTGPEGAPSNWNIGIRGLGLCILDFDPKDRPLGELIKDFKDKFGLLPKGTPIVRTPKGGVHAYLRLPDGMRVPNSVQKILPGVDVRGEDGYVVGPGSHTEANGGTVAGDYVLAEGDFSLVSGAPTGLLEACRAAKQSGHVAPADWGRFEVDTENQIASARAWLRDSAPEAIEGNGGRETTKSVIHRLGDEGLTAEAALELIFEDGGWNELKCVPSWEHAELDRLARDLLSPKYRDRPLGSGHTDRPVRPELSPEECFEAVALDDDWRPAQVREAQTHGEQSGALSRNHAPRPQLPAPPDRANLILSAWLDRDTPERDYLLGHVLCTTSRWFVIGETGIGKTLFGAALGGACAKGVKFLNWEARRPARVMYLDGELPIETFKERMQLLAKRYGRDISFFGYNREDLGFDNLPPLNTPAGQAWLRREIKAIEPDLIIFDSIMCLLLGSMLDEATWAPMKQLVCELSARKTAQVWFNHANDLGRSFGDKTREWEMDTVAKLVRVEGDENALRLEFAKARLRTPETATQFASLIIRPGDDWQFEYAKSVSGATKSSGDVADIMAEFPKVYDFLAAGSPESPGLDGRAVLKISTEEIRDELLSRGLLERDENGRISRVSRVHFYRAKKALVKRSTFTERKGQIWRS